MSTRWTGSGRHLAVAFPLRSYSCRSAPAKKKIEMWSTTGRVLAAVDSYWRVGPENRQDHDSPAIRLSDNVSEKPSYSERRGVG